MSLINVHFDQLSAWLKTVNFRCLFDLKDSPHWLQPRRWEDLASEGFIQTLIYCYHVHQRSTGTGTKKPGTFPGTWNHNFSKNRERAGTRHRFPMICGVRIVVQ